MHKIPFLMLCLLVLSSAKKPADSFKPVAVIELFTSEGCSSCPAADKLLGKTLTESALAGKNVFGLAFHVDYWNRLGWKDSFSTRQFSDRQSMYASAMHLDGVYTPQMVVNGSTQFVGSDKSALDEAILKSLQVKGGAEFNNLSAIKNGNVLDVNYELKGNLAGSLVGCALITLHTSTSVKRGENSGRVLEHTNVVRAFITTKASYSDKIVFDNIADYDLNNTAVVAFVQQDGSLHIIAAAMTKVK